MPPRTKEFYRSHFKQQRASLSESSTQYSRTICEFIQQSSEFRQAKQVAVFHGRPWEIQLRSLWEAHPQKCYFPRADAQTFRMEFYRVSEWSELKVGYGGILEPPADPARQAAEWKPKDLILVPGTCFDGQGGRIGSGMGFYDRFLGSLPSQFWGVCLSQQIIDSALAQDPTDVRMMALCTEKGIRRIL